MSEKSECVCEREAVPEARPNFLYPNEVILRKKKKIVLFLIFIYAYVPSNLCYKT